MKAKLYASFDQDSWKCNQGGLPRKKVAGLQTLSVTAPPEIHHHVKDLTGTPLDCLSTKSIYKLGHLKKFWIS